MSRGRRQWLPSAIAGALFVAALLVVSVVPRDRMASSNNRVAAPGGFLVMDPGRERCHGGEYVPAEARRLRVFAGTAEGRPGQPLRVRVTDRSGREVFRVRRAGGWQPGEVILDLPPHRTVELARVCITNLGDEAISLTGNFTSANPADPGRSNGPDQPPAADLPRLDFLLAEPAGGIEVAGRIGERSHVFKPGWQGAWTPWAVLAALLAAGLVGLRRLWTDFDRGIG